MQTSWYQSLKLFIEQWIPTRPHDPYHIYVGLIAFLLSGIILRKKYSNALCLLPGLILSVIMELLDFRDDLPSRALGWRPYVHGIIVTNLVPVTLWLFVRFGKSKFS